MENLMKDIVASRMSGQLECHLEKDEEFKKCKKSFLLYRKLRYSEIQKEQEFTKRMSDKLLPEYDNKTTRFRRYKNLPRQPRHQINRPRLRNNPCPEVHPRSCGECPRMSSLLVDYQYIFCVVSLCPASYEQPPLKGVYHRNWIYGSHADDLFPRERDMTFSYISSRETCLWLK